MIPLGDNNDDRKLTPYVNYALIAANILVFVLFQQLGANANFILSYSTVPAEILSGTDVTENGLLTTPIPVYGTLLTSMFMHGSIAHIGGNMPSI
jgi:membrane associated rhomboid family serine protease